MTTTRTRSGQSRTRSALLTALVALGLLATGASAADEPERGTLVVTGQGGTSVVVTLRSAYQVTDVVPVLEGGGSRYAGVLVEAVGPGQQGQPQRLGAVTVRAFADETSGEVALLGADGQLEPDQYRVTLLGDGPVTARWRLSDPDAPGLRITPTTPVPTAFLGRSTPLAAGSVSDRIELTSALPAGQRALLVVLHAGTSAEDLRACATTASDCAGSPLPTCPPSPVPCPSVPVPLLAPRLEPQASATVVPAAGSVRSLLWTVEGYRDTPGALRAAAVLLG